MFTTEVAKITSVCRQFSYKADRNQIGFLQLLSTHAEQNITYHCQNHVAVYNAQRQTYRGSLRLMSWNDQEIFARGRNRYNVIEDGCQVNALG